MSQESEIPQSLAQDHVLALRAVMAGIFRLDQINAGGRDQYGCPLLSPIIRTMLLEEFAKAKYGGIPATFVSRP